MTNLDFDDARHVRLPGTDQGLFDSDTPRLAGGASSWSKFPSVLACPPAVAGLACQRGGIWLAVAGRWLGGVPMKRACIAIVDATQAQIYMYDEAEDLGWVRPAADRRLRGGADLVNPVRRGRDPFSMRLRIEYPAGSDGSTGGRHAAQLDRLERTFARHVIAEVNRIAEQYGLAHVIVMATPEVLGELRTIDAALQHPDRVLEYVERDLARLTSPRAHGHLAQPRRFAACPRSMPIPR